MNKTILVLAAAAVLLVSAVFVSAHYVAEAPSGGETTVATAAPATVAGCASGACGAGSCDGACGGECGVKGCGCGRR